MVVLGDYNVQMQFLARNVNHDQRQLKLLKGYLPLYSVFLKLLIPVKSVLKRRRQMFWFSWVLVGSTKIIHFSYLAMKRMIYKRIWTIHRTPYRLHFSSPNCGLEENIHLHVRTVLMRQFLFMLFNWSI